VAEDELVSAAGVAATAEVSWAGARLALRPRARAREISLVGVFIIFLVVSFG